MPPTITLKATHFEAEAHGVSSLLVSLRWPWPGWRRGEARREFVSRFAALRVPLLLLLAALVLEKVIYYVALPLGGYVAASFDFDMARIESAHGDNAAALQWIRASLVRSRTDAASWQLAAQISERLDSPEATYCWRQLDRLAPGSFATQIRVAESALRYQQLDLAAGVLKEVSAIDQAKAAFLCVAGKLAMACNEEGEARSWFTRVAHLHPVDPPTLFALARWYAASGRPEDLTLAQRLLLGLAVRPESAVEAKRELSAIALLKGDRVAALKWSDEVRQSGSVQWKDEVARLDVLQGPALERALMRLLSANQTEEIVPIIDWMNTHGRAAQAFAWMHPQAQNFQRDPRAARALADCFSSLSRWKLLRETIVAENWKAMEHERLMYLARAQFETGADSDARAAWASAVTACRNYPDYLGLLSYLERNKLAVSSATFWTDARREVWMKMASRYPDQAWIVRLLLQDAVARRDSLEMQNCWLQLASLDPGDVDAAALGAQICLLRGVRVAQSSALLERIHASNPENPTASTARAFDLYRQGRFGDGLGVMGSLSPDAMAAGERAPYLGALLAVAGPLEQARTHLQIALARTDLLDEEIALTRRSLDLVSYRENVGTILHIAQGQTLSTVERPTVPATEPIGDSMLLRACESVRLSRTSHANEAAQILAGIDPTTLDPARLSIYVGAVLNLTDRQADAIPYLELSSELPFETQLEKLHKAMEAWWSLPSSSVGPAKLSGLFSVYRSLDLSESDAAFWQRDEPREWQLAREVLLHRGNAGAVEERLRGLLRHVPATPALQTQLAYSALLQGMPRAARERMGTLAPRDLQQPETALYYGVILQACGEKRAATPYLDSAAKANLRPEEVALLLRAGQTR